MTDTTVFICPFCGETQPAGDRCRSCLCLFEPLSRQATHNDMGPWFVRDRNRPFQPGCAYETLTKLIERGQVSNLDVLMRPVNAVIALREIIAPQMAAFLAQRSGEPPSKRGHE